jgi:hypothetical protein
LKDAELQSLEVMWMSAIAVATSGYLTTHAETGIAQNASFSRKKNGLSKEKKTFFRYHTSI